MTDTDALARFAAIEVYERAEPDRTPEEGLLHLWALGIRELERERGEAQAKYSLLAEAVNSMPGTHDDGCDSYGHSEACGEKEAQWPAEKIVALERELADWKSRAQANESRRIEAAKTAIDAQQEVSRCRVDIEQLERENRELREKQTGLDEKAPHIPPHTLDEKG